MRIAPLLLVVCCSVASCAKRTTTEATAASPTEPAASPLPAREAAVRSPMWDLRPVPAQAESMLINAGPLPLVQLFDQGGQVRIINGTTKQTLLSARVAPGSIVSVNDSGILIGRQRRLTTNLNPLHRYEIWWDMERSR